VIGRRRHGAIIMMIIYNCEFNSGKRSWCLSVCLSVCLSAHASVVTNSDLCIHTAMQMTVLDSQRVF
jgi:hypothetical protein